MIGEEIRKLVSPVVLCRLYQSLRFVLCSLYQSVALCTVQSVPVCGALYRVQFVPVSALCTVSSVQTHIVSGTDLPYGATACLVLLYHIAVLTERIVLQHLRY